MTKKSVRSTLEGESVRLSRLRTPGLVALASFAPPTATSAQELIVQVPEIAVAADEQLVDVCVAHVAEYNSAMVIAVVNPTGELMHFHTRQGASPTASLTA